MRDAMVELKHVWKVFDETVVAVSDVNLAVLPGEFVSFLGPSGCGKTTTLRMVAGFEVPTAGEIAIDGMDTSGVAPKDRHVAMVFQHYALFPHLNVFENVAFSLRVRGVPNEVLQRRVAEYLQLVRLPGYQARLPKQLSGGEQQRVSLARALISEPKVILLDEPLGALDRKLREEMQLELKQLLRRVNITALFVTHDQDEALVMSDRVAVMNQGVIEQLDTPEGLYERPRTPFVTTFVGVSNLFSGRVARRSDGAAVLDTGEMCLVLPGFPASAGSALVAIRPEKVRLEPALADGVNIFPATVQSVKYFGSTTQYRVVLPSGYVAVVDILNAASGSAYAEGRQLRVHFPLEHLRILETPPAAAAPHVVSEMAA